MTLYHVEVKGDKKMVIYVKNITIPPNTPKQTR